MIQNVTNHVTDSQSKNVTYRVIHKSNAFCFNFSMYNNLRKIRKTLGLNQDDFAALIKKSRVHVSRMENSPHPPSFRQANEIIKNINDHYGEDKVSILDFYDDQTSSDTPKIAKNEIQKKILEAMNQMSDKEQEMYGAGFLSGLNIHEKETEMPENQNKQSKI